MKKFIYRKELKEKLRLGDNEISPIITKAKVFQGLSAQQGYATAYDFDQSFLIFVGCELLRLGLSFRHVNLALTELSREVKSKFYESAKRNKKVMILFPRSKEVVFKSTKNQKQIPMDFIQADSLVKSGAAKKIVGKDVANDSPVSIDMVKEFYQQKIAPHVMVIENERDKSLSQKPYNTAIHAFIHIRLYNLIKDLDEVFE